MLVHTPSHNPNQTPSMSLGGAGAGVLSTLAIQKLAASRKDVMWLAASGNNGPNATLSYPAGFKEVISVGAVNWNMVLADFSSWNDQTPELTAPGEWGLCTQTKCTAVHYTSCCSTAQRYTLSDRSVARLFHTTYCSITATAALHAAYPAARVWRNALLLDPYCCDVMLRMHSR